MNYALSLFIERDEDRSGLFADFRDMTENWDPASSEHEEWISDPRRRPLALLIGGLEVDLPFPCLDLGAVSHNCSPLCLGADWAPAPPILAMRMRGLEPPRGCPHTDLNRARLPIPPHPRDGTV